MAREFASASAGGVSCAWEADSISEGNIKTQSHIEAYEETKESSELYEWLFSSHGEAPGHQVFITLARWSINNPDDFEELLNSMPSSETENFIRRYSFAITDSGNGERYTQTFGGSPRGIFPEIRSVVDSNLDMIERYKQGGGDA